MEHRMECGRLSVGKESRASAGGRGRGRSYVAVCADGEVKTTGGGEVTARAGNGVAGRCGSDGAQARRGFGARERGLTAFELMVALAIGAVLASLAVPGFAALRRSAGLSSAANELVWALHMARSSAVLRGLPVAVCLTGGDGACLAAPDLVAAGWTVFLPAGQASATRAAPVGEVLHRFHLPAGMTVRGTRPAVTFWPVTRAASTSTFDLCDAEGHGQGRSIVVSQTGRPRVATEAAQCAG